MITKHFNKTSLATLIAINKFKEASHEIYVLFANIISVTTCITSSRDLYMKQKL